MDEEVDEVMCSDDPSRDGQIFIKMKEDEEVVCTGCGRQSRMRTCKYCGDEPLVSQVTQSLLRRVETDSNNAIVEACQNDLDRAANMTALVAAMRTCEFMK